MTAPGSIEPGAFVRHTQPGRTGQLVDRYRVALVRGEQAILVRQGSAAAARVELAELAASPAWELEEASR